MLSFTSGLDAATQKREIINDDCTIIVVSQVDYCLWIASLQMSCIVMVSFLFFFSGILDSAKLHFVCKVAQ